MPKSDSVTFPLFYGQGDGPKSLADYFRSSEPTEAVEAEPTTTVANEPAQVEAVSVKVAFNRPLTWSEREAFRKFISKKNREHQWNNDSAVVIWDFDLDPCNDESTRKVTKDVAAFVATAFLNVHPRSAKSLYPEVIV